jgi:hypothetical protein
MWGRKRKLDTQAEGVPVSPLKEAVNQARIEAAERTSVIVDLRDADLFDRGLTRGETPRLWIDAVAHVSMGRDKRAYRFLHDTRIGRQVLADSHEIEDIVEAVTTYVARRIVERQRALDEDPEFIQRVTRTVADRERRRRRWRAVGAFTFGFFLGLLVLFAAAVLIAAQYH